MKPFAARPRRKGGHAIVVGGALGGLTAARVLSDRFERVTILERDRIPVGPENRPGVPHGPHLHVMLLRGWDIYCSLFPGLERDLAALGAPELHWLADWASFNNGRWAPRLVRDGRVIRSCTRALFEHAVRERLKELPNISLVEAVEVNGLLLDGSGRRAVGVTGRGSKGSAGVRADDLRGDLVVDASGRDARARGWLEQVGYPAPKTSVVNGFFGYASRLYAQPSDLARGWRALQVRAQLPSTRRGTIYPVEGERWVVTLTAAGRDYPPTDEAGFDGFVASLPDPSMAHALSAARPLSAIHGFRKMENRRVHYETLSRRPEAFVALGDAVCVVNPSYGQGMTLAALGALALGRCLDQSHARGGQHLEGLAARFQRELSRSTDFLWSVATGNDLRLPTTAGERRSRGPLRRALAWYTAKLSRYAAESPDVNRAMFEVINLVRSPRSLFLPHILARVLAARC